MNITWFGTATILIETKEEKILFDPFFRRNNKLEKASIEDFSCVDYIFNTHPHFDHLSDVPLILKHSNAKLYGTATAYLRLETQGVDVENKVEIICPNDFVKTKNTVIKSHRTYHIKNDLGIIIKKACKILFSFQYKKAFNILKEHNDFRMGGDIVAYEVKVEGKTILIFGSAGFDEHSNLPTNVDILIWPFQGRTNMCKYSLPIIQKINPKIIILDHFDNSFPPITGEVKCDRFVTQIKKKFPEIQVIIPKFKQKLTF